MLDCVWPGLTGSPREGWLHLPHITSQHRHASHYLRPNKISFVAPPDTNRKFGDDGVLHFEGGNNHGEILGVAHVQAGNRSENKKSRGGNAQFARLVVEQNSDGLVGMTDPLIDGKWIAAARTNSEFKFSFFITLQYDEKFGPDICRVKQTINAVSPPHAPPRHSVSHEMAAVNRTSRQQDHQQKQTEFAIKAIQICSSGIVHNPAIGVIVNGSVFSIYNIHAQLRLAQHNRFATSQGIGSE
jgi:hypothetical protein